MCKVSRVYCGITHQMLLRKMGIMNVILEESSGWRCLSAVQLSAPPPHYSPEPLTLHHIHVNSNAANTDPSQIRIARLPRTSHDNYRHCIYFTLDMLYVYLQICELS